MLHMLVQACIKVAWDYISEEDMASYVGVQHVQLKAMAGSAGGSHIAKDYIGVCQVVEQWWMRALVHHKVVASNFHTRMGI